MILELVELTDMVHVVFSNYNHLSEEERFGCLLELCFDCLCSVSLPHDAVDWSAFYDCGISWSFSLTFWFDHSITTILCVSDL